MTAPKLLGITGSLRKKSFNRALMKEVRGTLGDRVVLEEADIGSLPLYNGDLDGESKPAPVQRLLDQITAADALIVVTPEYNYSIPGVLKNAIDWASRPAYRAPLTNKRAAILGASMSAIGSARAQSHLRQVLGGTMTPVFPHPDFLVGVAQSKFDDEGKLVDESTAEHLASFLDKFLAWLA